VEDLNLESSGTIQTAGQLQYAAAGQPAAGETESGDRYIVVPTPTGTLIAVVDGLGHGHEAAEAAAVAVATLGRYAEEAVVPLVMRCHEAMKNTRGAVMSLATINAQARNVSWLSVGNVEGILLHPDPQASPDRKNILMRPGVVGFRLPVLQAGFMPLFPDDILIFATDGIRSGFEQDLSLKSPLQDIADSICARYSKGNDDALVLVARYRGVLVD
jgi:negative regulator of sigma-B (phosphoserine phosphatase)